MRFQLRYAPLLLPTTPQLSTPRCMYFVQDILIDMITDPHVVGDLQKQAAGRPVWVWVGGGGNVMVEPRIWMCWLRRRMHAAACCWAGQRSIPVAPAEHLDGCWRGCPSVSCLGKRGHSPCLTKPMPRYAVALFDLARHISLTAPIEVSPSPPSQQVRGRAQPGKGCIVFMWPLSGVGFSMLSMYV